MYKLHLFNCYFNRYLPIVGIYPMSEAMRLRSMGYVIITIPFNGVHLN